MSPAFFADHTAIRQSLRGRMCPGWAYVAEDIAIFDTQTSRRRAEAILSDSFQSRRMTLQISHLASKGFFVLKHSGIGVAKYSAPIQSVCWVLSVNEKREHQ